MSSSDECYEEQKRGEGKGAAEHPVTGGWSQRTVEGWTLEERPGEHWGANVWTSGVGTSRHTPQGGRCWPAGKSKALGWIEGQSEGKEEKILAFRYAFNLPFVKGFTHSKM